MEDYSYNPSNSKSSNVLHGKYEIDRIIGLGSFAKVYLAKNLETKRNVAVKVISKDEIIRCGMMDQMKREIAVMKKVDHPNIIKFHEVMASKSKIYLAMEYAKGGELFTKVYKGRLDENDARNFFRQLISAVDYCHGMGIYHRDLKPENLLLDENGNLKITDFGLSALSEHLRKDGLLHTACGTPSYVAPEVIGNRGYDGSMTDLWSCGVILFVLLSGYLPFQADNVISLYKRICRSEIRFPNWVSDEARVILNRILDPNPHTRITIAQLMETDWFKFKFNKEIDPIEELPEMESEIEIERENFNAFHLISMSDGFDLSGLFDKEKRELRFATEKSTRMAVERLEEVAAAAKFSVKMNGELKMKIEGKEKGRKGKLMIAAEMFAVTAALTVVEVKKDGGDTVEYNRFCCEELRPALTDIMWTSGNSMTA
ncbi:CBL-interacting serine/threonine-protein kinase 6-like [Impatiens glandulifera]|uniref:CBL-interacting serine/threonine-protein kinase 6-like n=1 Tax=Impatiens glandulifera TaxID=253017 RepID=UPI001FB0A3EF|nr:CBL-interacting serine/threonine-protein kinase 6-like [Impatiens glandulifera]